jgi:hypothetical protein
MILMHRLGCPMSGTLPAFVVVGLLCGCSSARLDPSTHAFSFNAPNLGSAAAAGTPGVPLGPERIPPKLRGTASDETAPATASTADQAGRKPHGCANLPDPSPMRTDRWVALTVRFDRSHIDIASSSQHRTRRLETTKRRMGRFAAELWIGCELIDRVRFDFPLLAGPSASDSSSTPNFEAAGRFEATVVLPDSERATRLELVDRATRTRMPFDWPLRAATRTESSPAATTKPAGEVPTSADQTSPRGAATVKPADEVPTSAEPTRSAP